MMGRAEHLLSHLRRLAPKIDGVVRSLTQVDEEARAAFEAIALFRCGGGKFDGVEYSSDDLAEFAPRTEPVVAEVVAAWSTLLCRQMGPRGADRVRHMEARSRLGLSPAPPLRRDPATREAVDRLRQRFEDSTGATRYWRDYLPLASEWVFCYSEPGSASHLKERPEWSLSDHSNLPAELEALYAELDGLDVFLGAAPGGRVPWRKGAEPVVAPLAYLQPLQTGSNPLLAIGVIRRSRIVFDPGTAAVQSIPWGARDLAKRRHLADDIPSFVRLLERTWGLCEPTGAG